MQIHRRTYNTSQGWYEIAGRKIYLRSSWEYRYAKFLQLMKEKGNIVEWEYEPKTFYFESIKRGTTSYKPDFRVTLPAGEVEWIEVKGYFDSKSLTKIKRFRKYFPDEKLRVVDAKWFILKKFYPLTRENPVLQG